MKHLDLFSGIGGFALAARWMGWETIQFVEIDKFCQKVLNKNFPNVPIHGDIKQFDGSKYRGTVDILTGGFPCQKFSMAGKGEADLSLWDEMFRIIRQVRPSIVVAENVYGLLIRKEGMVFECICAQLETQGYQVQSYIIPACAVNAPHKRDRIWITAYRDGDERHLAKSSERNKERYFAGLSTEKFITDSKSEGFQQGGIRGRDEEKIPESNNRARAFNWDSFPTQSPICRRDDGLPNRVDRIKSLGNAIVPQVAFEIFKAIELVTPNPKPKY
jgi:DNA (cytosine-5)-methyltransferase 1